LKRKRGKRNCREREREREGKEIYFVAGLNPLRTIGDYTKWRDL